MSTEVRKQVLAWETDQAATRATQRAVQDLHTRIEQLRSAIRQQAAEAAKLSAEWRRFAGGSSAATSNLDRLRGAASELRRTVDDMGEAVETADRKLANAKGPQAYEDRIRAARSQADIYGDIASRTTAVSGLASGLGFQGVGSGTMLAADIFDAVEAVKLAGPEFGKLKQQLLETGPVTGKLNAAIGKLPGSFTQASAKAAVLGTTVAAMFVAAIAVGAAINQFKTTMEQTGTATRNWTEAQKQYADVLATGTSEMARARIEQEQAAITRNEIEKERLQAWVDEADAQEGLAGGLIAANNALMDINASWGTNLGGMKDVRKRLDELNNAINSSEILVNDLSTALGEGAFAINDMKAAAEELAQVELSQFQAAVSLQRDIRNMTVDEAAQRLESEKAAIKVFGDAAAQARMAVDAAGYAQKKLDELEQLRAKPALNYQQQARLHQLEAEEQALRKAVALRDDMLKAQAGYELQMKVAQGNVEALTGELGNQNSWINHNTRAYDEANKVMRNHTAAVDAMTDAQSTSVQQAQAELEANRREQKAIQTTIQRLEAIGGTAAGEAIQELESDLTGLQDRAYYLQDVIIPTARALAEEAEQQDALNDAVQGAFQGLATATEVTNRFGLVAGRMTDAIAAAQDAALEAQHDAQQQQADLIAEHQQTVAAVSADRQREQARDAADFARKRAQAWAAHYRSLAEMDRSYFERRGDLIQDLSEIAGEANAERVEALEDYNKESARLAEDHQRDLLAIERDTQRDIRSAALRLDALSIWQAKQRGQEQLDDAEDQYTTEQERREEDFADRLDELDEQREARLEAGRQALRDLEAQHHRERQERVQDFNRTLAEEDRERAITRQRQREDWAREDAERRAHLSRKLAELSGSQAYERAMLSGHQAQERQLVAGHQGAIRASTDGFMRDLAGIFARGYAQITASAPPPTNMYGSTSGYIAPSLPTTSQTFMNTSFSVPVQVSPPPTTTGSSGSGTNWNDLDRLRRDIPTLIEDALLGLFGG